MILFVILRCTRQPDSKFKKTYNVLTVKFGIFSSGYLKSRLMPGGVY